MHAVDRLARAHMRVQRLQHQAVAAQRDDDVGVVGVVVAVKRGQFSSAACASVPALATKAILSYRLGPVIGRRTQLLAPGARRARLYTLAALVEMLRPANQAGRGSRPVTFPAASGPDPNPQPADFVPIPARARETSGTAGRSPRNGQNSSRQARTRGRASAQGLRRNARSIPAGPP